MADTEKSEQPQTNGLENGLDEDERNKMRPADIDADVKEMERRKRVEMVMSSKLFREELERIIELQLRDGNGPAGLLQQISDMMGIQSGKLHTAHMFRGSNCVTPINDIRGVESMGYEKGEKNLRCKLASVFRLMDLYGWSQGINNQVTARLNQDEEHFLVNPHGMLFNEITASSLVKVDMQGNIVEPGTTNFSVNTQGFLLHSAIHASRPDVNCVIHIKTPSVLAVSSLKCGLLPICQEALVIGEVSQHPFVSGIFEPEEREKIIRNLGPHNKVLLLHNHGAVCCGATIEEAFYNVYNTVLACETQMKLMPIGVENLLLVSDETRKQVYDAAHRPPDAGDKKKFRVGEMEFEALIRMLDNAGFRTGYIYRHPLVKGELPKPKNDVEVPPAVSSLGYLIEQEELYKQGNWKKYVDGRNRLDRTKWLNSPNVYQKVEILETGTSDPKKITKWVDQNSEEWVAESSPTHSSTPVKIDSALQFVPKGTNPKEFKKLQQQIKENRRADKITSGPQSHILEGVSWEEAKKLQDANITQTGDQVILVGAASKGIIQRNYQHNALVYKTPYAKNPFDSMSDKEIEDYKKLVERKQWGDTDYEESQSESEAISSSRQDGLRRFKSPLLSPQSATSETEEESRDEPRVLRIETKTAPRPIQAEVVLSDGESDTTDARVERSHSARYPKAEKPESVTLMNSFRKSWSLKREKDKSKDVEIYETSNFHPSLSLKECEQDRMDSLHCCVARIKQLTHKPVIVDVCTKVSRPLFKSASDPCNLSTLNDETASDGNSRQAGVSKDPNTSLVCDNIVNTSELQQRLHMRKKMLHSAKMKFLGFQKAGGEQSSEVKDKTPTSPMCALISEIRETISEIMSPERSVALEDSDDYFNSMRWIERPKFMSRSTESQLKSNNKFEGLMSKVFLSKSIGDLSNDNLRFPLETFREFKNDFQVLKLDLENSERSDTSNCNCAIHRGNTREKNPAEKPIFDENQNEEKPVENVVTEIVKFVNASDEEATYTITDDSLLQTYSFTESTETEWYYNKTIMKLENSQTVLEIKETENKEENVEIPAVKYIDTGIDTDFTSEKENESKNDNPPVEEPKEAFEVTEDIDGDAPVCESSGLNKSSETDSSFLKSSSGRTSNDVDTSFAFKTETENSERTSDKSPEKNSRSIEEKKKFLEEMLLKTKEPIEEESSDSAEANGNENPEESEMQREGSHPKLSDIPESPEFTNIDTEDAPVTSSSKDTSPEVAIGQRTEDEPSEGAKDPEVDAEGEKENIKPEQKRKKNVKSSTKITVKKELKEKDAKDSVVSEIRLTIKNRSVNCQSEKYEVKIQDMTNTSEELSRSVSSADSFVQNVDSYESFEIVDKSCECDAQQSLEELQGEVMSTVEKLHTIEDYFEDEIKKRSNIGPENIRNGSEECTIEYNYREFEEVLNESHGKTGLKEVLEAGDVPLSVEDVSISKQKNKNTEFFISSPLGDIWGEIELCDGTDGVELSSVIGEEYEKDNTPMTQDMEDLAMSSAFVAAILSEAVLEENICTSRSEEFDGGEASSKGGEIVEMFSNVEELTGAVVSETVPTEQEAVVVELFAEIIDRLYLEVESSQEDSLAGGNCGKEQGEQLHENHFSSSEEVTEYVVENQEYRFCQSPIGTVIEEEESKEIKVKGPELSCRQPFNECEEVIDKQNCEQSKSDVSEVIQNEEQLEAVIGGFGNVQSSEQAIELNYGLENILEVSEQYNSQCQLKVANVEFDGPVIYSQKVDIIGGSLSAGDKQETTEHISEDYQNCQQSLKGNDSTKDNEYQQDRKEEHKAYQQAWEENCEEHDCQQPSEKSKDCKDEQSDCQQGLEETGSAKQEQDEYQPLGGAVGDRNTVKMFSVKSCDPTEEQDNWKEEDSKSEQNDYREPLEGSDDGKAEQYKCPELQDGNDCIGEDKKNCPQLSEGNFDSIKEPTDWKQLLQSDNQSRDEQNDYFEKTDDSKVENSDYQQPLEENNNSDKEAYNCQELLKGNNDTEDKQQNSQQPPEANNYLEPQQDHKYPTVETNMVEQESHILALARILFPTSLKAITYEPLDVQGNFCDRTSDSTPVEYIFNYLLNSVTEKSPKNLTSMNDVINFIVTNEESPMDSLAEFEDIENIISVSSSIVADIIDSVESQMEGEVESLPDEDMKDTDGWRSEKRKRKKGDSMFQVTIATPTKKEIFINYSLDYSSTFNTSTESGDLCNSYIKTDDVNEDFENFSSDNPDFFSAGSCSGKNSLNSSFCSAEGHATPEQFCCVGCETNGLKSPRSLAIIQEVDEGDSSSSSEAAALSNSD